MAVINEDQFNNYLDYTRDLSTTTARCVSEHSTPIAGMDTLDVLETFEEMTSDVTPNALTGEEMDDLLAAIDNAVYTSKEWLRNCPTCYARLLTVWPTTPDRPAFPAPLFTNQRPIQQPTLTVGEWTVTASYNPNVSDSPTQWLSFEVSNSTKTVFLRASDIHPLDVRDGAPSGITGLTDLTGLGRLITMTFPDGYEAIESQHESLTGLLEAVMDLHTLTEGAAHPRDYEMVLHGLRPAWVPKWRMLWTCEDMPPADPTELVRWVERAEPMYLTPDMFPGWEPTPMAPIPLPLDHLRAFALFVERGWAAADFQRLLDVTRGELNNGWCRLPVEEAILGERAGLSPTEVREMLESGRWDERRMRLLGGLRPES